MPQPADYYELLHIQPDAPPALIKASYRTLMQKLKMHPDLGGDPASASQINKAYEVLSDPIERQKYDARRVSTLPQNVEPSKQAERKPVPRVMWNDSMLRENSLCLFCGTKHAYESSPPQAAFCTTCDSPLARADRITWAPKQRRQLERLGLERPVRYRSFPGGLTKEAITVDLSLTGLGIIADDDLVTNQLLQISSDFCRAISRVVHIESLAGVSTQAGKRFGIEFVSLHLPNPTGSLISTRA